MSDKHASSGRAPKAGKSAAQAAGPATADEPTTRSWYLGAATANELSEVCNELFFDLRGTVPKYEILSLLIHEGLKNKERVRRRLLAQRNE
ncbi:hypothetical protein L3Q67_45200 (plasmid) [Saccharothrix sp. AJ9571]|nr:hypothetical protein L3Q67_45200 [Saccharothrix sp. AJ9571]